MLSLMALLSVLLILAAGRVEKMSVRGISLDAVDKRTSAYQFYCHIILFLFISVACMYASYKLFS